MKSYNQLKQEEQELREVLRERRVELRIANNEVLRKYSERLNK